MGPPPPIVHIINHIELLGSTNLPEFRIGEIEMKKSYQDNIATMGYYVRGIIRNLKPVIKIILGRSEWPEITVDDLLDRINSSQPPLVLDIRSAQEFNGADGHIPNARSISITKLASNLEGLQSFKDKEIVTCCPGGGLSLVAVDILVKAGFKDAKSLRGGMDLWFQNAYPTITVEDIIYPHEDIEPESLEDGAGIVEGTQPLEEESMIEVHHTLDVRNFACPIPILKSREALKALKINQVLEILTTDPGSKSDIPAWARATGQELLVSEERGPNDFRFLVKRMK